MANWTEIEEILRPLGLTHRIPRIRTMIEQLVKKYEGRVPNSYRSLLRLPGVGRYIASAVLCFGFNKRVPIVDSNIARFYLRFFGLKDIKKRSHEDKRILHIAKECLPRKNVREFNEALLDFTASICKPKPRCDKCPLETLCNYPKQVNH